MSSATATTPVSTASMMPGRHPFSLQCSHTQGCQVQAGASIRMKHSGLNVGHIWHHAQPFENASQFQISIPTPLGCLPTPLGLPSKVPTSSIHYTSFRPQSQDTIHTYYTGSECPRCRNDTHTRETPRQDRNPCPTAPTIQPNHAGWHAPSPDRLPKTTPWFRLGETSTSQGATHRFFLICYAQPR